jgi:hypothetical protein
VVGNNILFNSSEYATDTTLRPKLTVAYAPPPGDATSTALSSSANPSLVGQSVTFTASITGVSPTGTVAFNDSATPLSGCGAVALTGSGNTRSANCTSSALTQGSHPITATYSGDAANAPSSSPALLQVVTTSGPSAPVLTSVSSQKVHGSAGTFDLPLSLAAATPTIEPRSGPAHTLVFVFDKPVVGAGVAVTEGTATVGATTFTGNSVVVDLTNVSNQQYVTIALTNVASSDGGTGGTGGVRIGFLLGDTNQDGVVTLADVALVNSRLAQTVSAVNFLSDVDVSGALTISDKALTNAQLTKGLPAP